jgi:hypothetical protein
VTGYFDKVFAGVRIRCLEYADEYVVENDAFVDQLSVVEGVGLDFGEVFFWKECGYYFKGPIAGNAYDAQSGDAWWCGDGGDGVG